MKPMVSGVYMLFLKHELVYIGRSSDCYGRINTHRANGRPFDASFVTPISTEDVRWVEAALIEALQSKQNRVGGSLRAARAAAPESALAIPPKAGEGDSLATINMTQARRQLRQRGVSGCDFNEAIILGHLASYQKGVGHERLIRVSTFDAWCEATQELKQKFQARAGSETGDGTRIFSAAHN